MSNSIYVAAPEGLTGKSMIAVGMIEALTRTVSSVGVFRPVVRSGPQDEGLIVVVTLGVFALLRRLDKRIVMATNALLDNGDELLLPSPDYPLWTAAASLSGGTPVH